MSLSNSVLDTRFRSALGRMAEAGRLQTYSVPVDTYLEVAGLMKKLDGGPALLFSKVDGYDIPVIGNLLSCQANVEAAFGADFRGVRELVGRALGDPKPPVLVERAPVQEQVHTKDIDIGKMLPALHHTADDAGRYLTAGMLVARDPETGVETEGYHRFQLKGPDRLGVSLHSRRRMFEYQRRAEARGQALPCAIVLGLHPLVSMGSLAYPPADVGKFEVVGGLLGEPLEVAPCSTIDLHVPAAAEIVIEGEILAGVREPEGPFGEFTGYFSRRSTQHVFVAKALSMRERPWFQSIGSGRAGDHITTLGLVREAEIHNALGRVIPNVAGVHVPLSGTSSFSAYVAIKQGRPGEAKHVIPIVLGVDHYLKLVIVVDDDIDVFDESDVMWAVATRMQADRDLVTVAGSLGALLDPSADERGVTAKLGIDATRPFGEPFADKLVMDPERMAWARALVDRLGR